MNRFLEALLARPSVYRLWQAPFARAKLTPIVDRNDLGTVRRVLDLGCGPGTNTAIFARCDYLGVDLNPDYVESVRRRFGRPAIASDVRELRVPEGERFDFVLLNSLLHHVDDDGVAKILERSRDALSADGRVHVLDLVLPAAAGIARRLARMDRGGFARPLERWRELFSAFFEPELFEPYPVGVGPLTLWSMVYFRGRRRP